MKKFADVFSFFLIFFATQTSLGMNEIAQNELSPNVMEILNQKISFEKLDALHQWMRREKPIKYDIEKGCCNPHVSFSSLHQRLAFESETWFFIFIKDKNLREKVGSVLDNLVTDLALSIDYSFGPVFKMYADRHRAARLAEENPRCIENLIIEACLMDLLEWASREKKRDYFFQLKEAFMAWMFDLDIIGKDYDFQKQLEKQKGFFPRLFGLR